MGNTSTNLFYLPLFKALLQPGEVQHRDPGPTRLWKVNTTRWIRGQQYAGSKHRIIRVGVKVYITIPRSWIAVIQRYRVFIKYCVFFHDFEIYSRLCVSMCMYTACGPPRQMAGRTPALKQNWQSLEKSQLLKEKTQYLMNTLYHPSSLNPFKDL